ncbi:hypothetical protein KA977_06455 [Candidatus Dependentiae bacterium]|nr:hypothetical protein [Candidatus Dependentiae bacterium]
MIIYLLYALYSFFLIFLLVSSVLQIKKYFNSTIDGFIHYENSLKTIIIPHSLILLISLITFFVYLIIYNDQTITIKSFGTSMIFICFASAINLVIYYFLYYFLHKKLKNEGYITMIELEESEIEPRYINELLKKEYFNIVRNNLGLLFIIYLFFFIFPTSLIEESKPIIKSDDKQIEGRSIVKDAQFYAGQNWFYKLVEVRKKYIEKHGIAKYKQVFGEKMAPIESDIREFELKQETLKFEKENIEKAKERILFSTYDRLSDTALLDKKFSNQR